MLFSFCWLRVIIDRLVVSAVCLASNLLLLVLYNKRLIGFDFFDCVPGSSSALGGAVLTGPQGHRMLARKVIITVPLKVLQSSLITFQPSLPPAKMGAVQRLKMGNAVKVRYLVCLCEFTWLCGCRGGEQREGQTRGEIQKRESKGIKGEGRAEHRRKIREGRAWAVGMQQWQRKGRQQEYIER